MRTRLEPGMIVGGSVAAFRWGSLRAVQKLRLTLERFHLSIISRQKGSKLGGDV
jgi:hypothetical protein